MTVQRAAQVRAEKPATAASEDANSEFPVREYIGAMALELAQMARWDGDEALARVLDSAASLAGETLVRKPVEAVGSARRLPS